MPKLLDALKQTSDLPQCYSRYVEMILITVKLLYNRLKVKYMTFDAVCCVAV